MRRRSWFFVLIVCFAGTILAQSDSELSSEPVYIPDLNLKEAIESALGITNPNPAEIENLTKLEYLQLENNPMTIILYRQ